MTAQDMADACAALGLTVPRTVIANLETGRRAAIDLAELLVLAKVLDVPPISLLSPSTTRPPWPYSPARNPDEGTHT